MLVWLADYLSQYVNALAVVQYLTLRGFLGALTALGISLLVGPAMIRRLNARHIGQAIRDDGARSHPSQSGTVTRGGTLILVAIHLAPLLWYDLHTPHV